MEAGSEKRPVSANQNQARRLLQVETVDVDVGR